MANEPFFRIDGTHYVPTPAGRGPWDPNSLHGRVIVRSGADWPLQRPNGVIDFDARYMFELDDGAIIYVQNRGFRWGSEEAMAAMARHEEVGPDSPAIDHSRTRSWSCCS